ncbi:hypothetical protein ACP70R_035278 [Stipagrostis hirtigluma subsp. patula]
METPKLAPMRLHFILAISLLLSAAQGNTSSDDRQPPLVARLGKDPATSLYTISIKDGGAPLVVDLAGPLVWSTCQTVQHTFPCDSAECATAANAPPPGCENADYGAADGDRQHGGGWSSRCRCTAHPCSPVPPGLCAAGDLTSFAMSADATDGRNTLFPVSFTAVGACAPERLLRSLPAGATGVAGFGRGAALSLPSQLAAQRRFGRSFALCLPGVALFGDTPIYLMGYPPELTAVIAHTPLVRNPRGGGGGYYLPVESISVYWNGATTPESIPPGALAIDPWTGRGGVTLSTVQRHTSVRGDVLRPLLQAFDAAVAAAGYVNRTAAVAPFQLCYDTFTMRRTKRTGWDFPSIRLELAAGASMNWSLDNGNYLVQAADRTACLAFVEMGEEAGHDDEAAPAMVIGGYQLEDNLLVFDEDEEVLHFSGLLWGSGATCSSF